MSESKRASDGLEDEWEASGFGEFFEPTDHRQKHVHEEVRRMLLKDPAQTQTFMELLREFAHRLAQASDFHKTGRVRTLAPLSGVLVTPIPHPVPDPMQNQLTVNTITYDPELHVAVPIGTGSPQGARGAITRRLNELLPPGVEVMADRYAQSAERAGPMRQTLQSYMAAPGALQLPRSRAGVRGAFIKAAQHASALWEGLVTADHPTLRQISKQVKDPNEPLVQLLKHPFEVVDVSPLRANREEPGRYLLRIAFVVSAP